MGATFEVCGETYLFAASCAWAKLPNFIYNSKPTIFGHFVGVDLRDLRESSALIAALDREGELVLELPVQAQCTAELGREVVNSARPCRKAYTTSSQRSFTSSLPKIDVRW